MESLGITENYGIFLRACEGLPLLILMVAFLAIVYVFRDE
jgi:uncharacterized membrane protein YhdT